MITICPVELHAHPGWVDRVGGALGEQHWRRWIGLGLRLRRRAGKVPAGHRWPFRAGQHGHRDEPMIGAAGVGRQRGDGVPAVGLADGRHLARVQQAGERVAQPGAERKQPTEHIGHVGRLVHQVGFVRNAGLAWASGRGVADQAVSPGEVYGCHHIPRPRPAIEQIRVGPAALHEARREKQQRKRTAGLRRADRDLTPGQRVGDRRQQGACAERSARHAGVRGLGECHLALADPVGSRDADTRARARLADHRLGGDLTVCRLGRDRMGSGGPRRLRLRRSTAGAGGRSDHDRGK